MIIITCAKCRYGFCHNLEEPPHLTAFVRDWYFNICIFITKISMVNTFCAKINYNISFSWLNKKIYVWTKWAHSTVLVQKTATDLHGFRWCKNQRGSHWVIPRWQYLVQICHVYSQITKKCHSYNPMQQDGRSVA